MLPPPLECIPPWVMDPPCGRQKVRHDLVGPFATFCQEIKSDSLFVVDGKFRDISSSLSVLWISESLERSHNHT